MSQATELANTTYIAPIEDPKDLTFNTTAGFALIQKQAKLFAYSSIVPEAFQVNGRPKRDGQPNSENTAIANCAIAINMALRMNIEPMTIFQQMFVINGKPAFSSAFLIGLFNKSDRFSPIEYKFIGQKGTDSYGCIACTFDTKIQKNLDGPEVTIGMAKKEGWYGKPGSKWPTMSDIMLRYRAAAFLIRTTVPEICLGLNTVEEVRDAETFTTTARLVDEPVQGNTSPTQQTENPALTVTNRRQPLRTHTNQQAVQQTQTQPQAPQAAPVQQPQQAPQAQGQTAQRSQQQTQAQAQQTPQQVQPQSHPQQQGSSRGSERQEYAPRQEPSAAPRQQAKAQPQQSTASPQNMSPNTNGSSFVCPQSSQRVTEQDCIARGCTNGCPEWAEEL